MLTRRSNSLKIYQIFCLVPLNVTLIAKKKVCGKKNLLRSNNSGFGGLEVSCWPLVPKFAGSNRAEAVGFLRVNKNPQHVGGHGCLSVVIVVCCQVEVSATN